MFQAGCFENTNTKQCTASRSREKWCTRYVGGVPNERETNVLPRIVCTHDAALQTCPVRSTIPRHLECPVWSESFCPVYSFLLCFFILHPLLYFTTRQGFIYIVSLNSEDVSSRKRRMMHSKCELATIGILRQHHVLVRYFVR